MPRKPQKDQIRMQYFTWLIGNRKGVFFADGRGNKPNLGRHSLGTRDPTEMREQLQRLDLVKAVEFGFADAAVLKEDGPQLLPLEQGRSLYMEHSGRPAIQGGTTLATQKRYRTVFDKFIAFAKQKGVRYWQQVTKTTLSNYGRWLENNDYHDKTHYFELNQLKSIVKWLVDEGHLPATCVIRFPLVKTQGTTTYCFSLEQVLAIRDHCRERQELHWLADVVVTLAFTGLRIGELAELRWADIDLKTGFLQLTDTSRSGRRSERHQERTTKSHRGRSLPIGAELRAVLEGLVRRQDGRVFQGPNGGKLKPDTVRNILIRDVLEPLSDRFPTTAEDRGIIAGRPHSFRHFFCSWCADKNIPEQMLMSWLGHRESEMIRHYYHLRQDEARRQMQKLSLQQPDPEPAPPSAQ
jgi:integrase